MLAESGDRRVGVEHVVQAGATMTESARAGERSAFTAGAETQRADRRVVDRLLAASRADGIVELLRVWQLFDDEIGRVESVVGRSELVALRDSTMASMVARHLADLRSQFQGSSSKGYDVWLESVARALADFRLGFIERLGDDTLGIEQSQRSVVEGVRQSARWM